MALQLTVVLAVLGFTAAFPALSPLAELLMPRAPSISSGCSTSGTQSCRNTTVVPDLCCFESPGGLLLQTQFWDYNPSTGPSNSWTIHGLWPDHCDQTYDSSCDSSRAYTNVASLLSAQGASSTLSYMQTYWVDINGQNEQFWEHEWASHGTCMSTLKPACLPSGSPTGAEAVAFFQTVVRLFQSLPTYTWLANAGITPSSSQTHTLSAITSALSTAAGVTPVLGCTSGNLNTISWYFNLKGSIIDGVFVPINAPASGSCPSSGIKYPPKSGGITTTSTTTTSPTTTSGSPTTTGAPGSLPTQAIIQALYSGSFVGGLLSRGTWSTQTLATYTLSGSASSFTLTSSKGSCGVSGGVFSCGNGVSSSFSAVTSGSNLLLASGGSTAFSSDGTPSGTTAYDVYTDKSHAQVYSLVIT